MSAAWAALLIWGPRRWVAALLATLGTVLVLGLPSDLVPNPIFARQIPAPGWAWPALLATSLLSGLLFATYVRQPGVHDAEAAGDPAARRGLIGGVLTFFAVGCPVCNKVALLALGYAGALRWFAPVQPYLGLVAIGVLAWALVFRLRNETSCPLPTDAPTPTPTRR